MRSTVTGRAEGRDTAPRPDPCPPLTRTRCTLTLLVFVHRQRSEGGPVRRQLSHQDNVKWGQQLFHVFNINVPASAHETVSTFDLKTSASYCHSEANTLFSGSKWKQKFPGAQRGRDLRDEKSAAGWRGDGRHVPHTTQAKRAVSHICRRRSSQRDPS